MKRIALVVLIMLLISLTAYADSPNSFYEYSTDNYNGLIWSTDYVGNAVPAPAAYVVERIIDNRALGIKDPFIFPEDFCFGPDGALYLLDSGDMEKGNGRIVVLEPDFKKVRYIIGAYSMSGQKYNFRGSRGIFVSQKNKVYICDTQGGRILSFDLSDPSAYSRDPYDNTIEINECRIFEKPAIESIKENFDYKPVCIVVDRSERMFVVGEGVFDGLITLDVDGTFAGFIGSNRVTPSLIDLIWRQFSTEEQIEKQIDFIPVEFSSIAIDENGFIYTTARGDAQNQMIRKLNLAGTDVLRRNTLPMNGDISPLRNIGTPGTDSSFIDVATGPYGTFSCLDSERGRIFTYDSDGNMIFEIGGLQDQKGSFKKPVAIDWSGEKIIVLDQYYGELTVFRKTEYGTYILNAIEHQKKGEFDEARDDWENVLMMNANNQFAHLNVGKSLYNQGKFEEAMRHFKIGNSQVLYSRAFAKIRKQRVERILPYVFIALGLIVSVYGILQMIKKLKEYRERFELFMEVAKQKSMLRNKKGGME